MSVLQYIAVCCSVLPRTPAPRHMESTWTLLVAVYVAVLVAVCCSVLQCVAMCCNVLQCAAVCCPARQRFAIWNPRHCNTMQHTASQYCNTDHCVERNLVTTATHCNTALQHSTATQHCNTALQHTATQHCNTDHYVKREPAAMQCVAMQRIAVCCGVLQCVAVCCGVLQWPLCREEAIVQVADLLKTQSIFFLNISILVFVFFCGCNVLQCVAVCCKDPVDFLLEHFDLGIRGFLQSHVSRVMSHI